MNPIATLIKIKDEWEGYIAYLKEKYSAEDGQAWVCTCPFHRRLCAIIERIDIDQLQKDDNELDKEIMMMRALDAAGVDNWEGTMRL